MAKDLRDPCEVGRAVLNELDALRREAPGEFAALVPSAATAEDYLPRYNIASFPGDESPLDRYGDPRLTEVTVETVVRRLPIERLAR